jgi:hypothetical protein
MLPQPRCKEVDVAKPSGRDIVDRYMRAMGRDLDAVWELQHPDFIDEWPQSGERLRGRENARKTMERYPGAERGMGADEIRDIVGAKDDWVMAPGPTFAPVHIVGTGDTYTVESKGHYPDGSVWFVIAIIQLKDDKVYRQTTYFAPTYEAPEWRAEFVERME